MKAIRYRRYGTSDELRFEDVALPDPARGQVRVLVRAASHNPMDGKIRRGEMKMVTGHRFPRGLGHDFVGVIDAVVALVAAMNEPCLTVYDEDPPLKDLIRA